MDFLHLQMAVQQIMEAGRPMGDAEELINDPAADLSEDQRAALWLWAWSFVPAHSQRLEALLHLQALDSPSY